MTMGQLAVETDREPKGRGLALVLVGIMLALGTVPVAMMSWPHGPGPDAFRPTSVAAPVVVAQRPILFVDRDNGTAAVLDADDRTELAAMSAGEGGFVRTALRLMIVERRRHDAPADQAFRLTQWSTGSVTLEDQATGKTLELKAFGATNAEAFARLLETRRKQQ